MQTTCEETVSARPAARLAFGAVCFTLSLVLPAALPAAEVDLAKAVIVSPKNASPRQALAVRVLVEEVEKRTQIHWKVSDTWPQAPAPAIVVGLSDFVEPLLQQHSLTASAAVAGAEGYRVRAFEGNPGSVMIAGNDERGVLFGVGHLLRELRLAKQHAELPADVNIATAPKYPLRGHQLGYRPKTNSYDAWSVPVWDQYIRDLAVFGTNAIELIPPRSDDAADSPHFPLPQMQMMIEMSRICDEYGLDVWVWYPAMDPKYADPATVEAALVEWADVIKQLPRVDAILVPGGDPGHTDPRVLLPFLEKQTASLRRFHPKLQMWVSPQSFSEEWTNAFISYLKDKNPEWLAGVVYGPQIRISLPELRKLVPKKYPIRRYPDITHSRQCQYPVPEWDIAYASTEGREVINPRPRDEAHIFRALADQGIGFITYSEGCNDDVNKIVWSGLGWDPQKPVVDILREYARYFLNDSYADDFAQGLLALESNWRGPLLTNRGVMTTLQQFQAMEHTAPPALSLNWRFQQALYRAYYDAFVYKRLVYETDLEQQALTRLSTVERSDILRALSDAESILDRTLADPAALELRARVFELGDSLFQSIRMQLSVGRHQAIATDRGATLDTIDMPLNNRPWLKHRFAEIRKIDGENQRLGAIREIVHWTDPGPGGFHDDLGNAACQPHLVRGVGLKADPGCYDTARCGFITGRFALANPLPRSWMDNEETLYDGPLKMQYERLDPHAQYAVRIAYASDAPGVKIRLMADDQYVVHPEMAKPRRPAVVEFDIPRAATHDGRLTLTWYREKGLGGNGRGNTVAEVWLIKKSG